MMEEEKDYYRPQEPTVGHQPRRAEEELESDYDKEKDILMENRIFAALSYVSVLFVVPMVLRQENEEIAFHARQGFVLFCAEVAVWFVLTILLNGFFTILFPNGQFFLIRMLGALAWLMFLGVSVWAAYNAIRGKRWEIPYLGRFTRRVKI